MSEIPLGRFAWYELLTTDPDAAPAFYGTIAGWTTSRWQGEDGEPYTMWVNGEAPIGGVMRLPDEAVAMGAPPHWLVHISTPNLEETTRKASDMGAEILNRIQVPTVGDFAVVRDPQGAVFSAYQPAGEAPGHDGPGQVGEFSWHELATDDWEAAWHFYSTLFGWQKTDAMDMGELGTYQMYGRGGDPLGGLYDRPPQIPVSAWLFYIRVPDATDAAEKVKAHGGTVLNGPMEVPGGGMIAQCSDPQGAMFAVHSAPTS